MYVNLWKWISCFLVTFYMTYRLLLIIAFWLHEPQQMSFILLYFTRCSLANMQSLTHGKGRPVIVLFSFRRKSLPWLLRANNNQVHGFIHGFLWMFKVITIFFGATTNITNTYTERYLPDRVRFCSFLRMPFVTPSPDLLTNTIFLKFPKSSIGRIN